MNADSGVRVVKVFVSSPVDVAPERGRVQAVATKLNREYEGQVEFDTVLWEEHFYKADRSFQPQIQQPEACDVLVSIFWTRVGTELPADFARMPNGKPYPSGTAYELITALAASKARGLPDVYVFRKTADAALPTADLERRRQAETQLNALEAFWSEWFKSEQGHFKAAFQTFGTTDEFERQIEELLRQWLESRHLLGPRLKWPKEKGSPFPGLAAFEAEQAPVFFGRDRTIDDARLALATAAAHGTAFLLIVGASGSGKSSLARAGLIPRLTTPGVIADVDVWRTALMKPSEAQAGPVASLAAALFDALPELAQGDFPNAEALTDNLQRGGAAAARPVTGALTRIADAAQAKRQSETALRPGLALLVDQLDELFAQAIGEAERTAFAEAVKELIGTRQVWCIATLRADLYEQVLKQPVLKALKEAGSSFDLGPPGPAELAEIVRAPATAAGLLFEASREKGELDERLLADAKTADSLPLLQFTLRQLYERRVETDGKTVLTHSAYETLGGLQGAIAAEAERAVERLPSETLAALPLLLRQLAEPARGANTLTLRDVRLSDVTANPAEAALVQALLKARILIARQGSAQQPTLRLAHDAVLTSWPRAEAAAQASRKFYRVRAEVEDALRLWREHGQPKDRLIQRGVPLAEAEKVVADFSGELPPGLVAYVNASRKQARMRQRLVALSAAFFFVLALIAVALGAMAFREQQKEMAAREIATHAQRIATNLLLDIARELREITGIRAATVSKILEGAKARYEPLATAAPNDTDLQSGYAAILIEYGNTYVTLGNLAQAQTEYRAGIDILERLHSTDPGDAQWRQNLSLAYGRIGNTLLAKGDVSGALATYRSSLDLIVPLAKADPGNLAWQRATTQAYRNIGDALAAMGDLAGATAAYRASREISQNLAVHHPTDLSAQRELILSLERVGGVQMQMGDLAGAKQSYRQALAVAERLTRSDSGNADWQRDLAVSHVRIGDLELAQANPTAALQSYRASLDITERLVGSDAGNTDWQHVLALIHFKIATVYRLNNDRDNVVAQLRQGLEIMHRLLQIAPDNAGWKRELAMFSDQINRLSK